jgi:hypothetical protein
MIMEIAWRTDGERMETALRAGRETMANRRFKDWKKSCIQAR